MRKLQKSFLKKTLEVYYSQTINNIATEMVTRNSRKIERKISLKTGNGKKHTLRLKHFKEGENPFEWYYYRSEETQKIDFLPIFLMGSKLKGGELIYFLEDFPKNSSTKNPSVYFKQFTELLKFLSSNFCKNQMNTSYNNCFRKYLKSNKESKLISYLEKTNYKNNLEISMLLNEKNLAYTKKSLKLMDLNNLEAHFAGFSFWSLYNNSDNIEFKDFYDEYFSQKEKQKLNIDILKNLSYMEYKFNKEYEKKEN
ncbi:MAG: hypothetical protein FXF47_00610 [Candidatus Mcinerneyibacterium aminivorans]|uniref:Uncharacterized protein n=1 Tax=Candidatus Mcinerneyibacterium aminivorans TaxID=2703815 RepID=A0A5D0MLI5_9BACT|nr:MAG: hypothetical protein FXF47_00610 [Candidatus Mcinerneyibacterium aminivorans]